MVLGVKVIFWKRQLAAPSEIRKSTLDISAISLKKKGCKAVIFDKDNTLTLPYDAKAIPGFKKKIDEFRKVFSGRVAVLSNSAGSSDDPQFKEAASAESGLGLPILHHRRKKPACINDIKRFARCRTDEIALIGDRIITDIAFGNMYGMYTILVSPVSRNEILAVRIARKIENWLLR